MDNSFEKIKAIISELEDDSKKFYEKRNKAAGRRLRAGLQTIKTLATEGRKEITNITNAGTEEVENPY